MTTHRTKRRPAKPCQFETEVAGPHPGCAEFAAPELHICTAPATHVVKAPGQRRGEHFTERVCAWHARYLREAVGASAYRFRRVGVSR